MFKIKCGVVEKSKQNVAYENLSGFNIFINFKNVTWLFFFSEFNFLVSKVKWEVFICMNHLTYVILYFLNNIMNHLNN